MLPGFASLQSASQHASGAASYEGSPGGARSRDWCGITTIGAVDESAEPAPHDPKRIQRWARRVCMGLALLGFCYLWLRFSITGAPPNLVRWPYKDTALIVDEWPGWGRPLEQDDLVFYLFPGEAQPRPVSVVGLPGQPVRSVSATPA